MEMYVLYYRPLKFRPQNNDLITQIGLRLARLLAPNHSVTSIVRKKEQDADVRATSATPVILDLESSPTSEFSLAFEEAHVVYFSAGAGENASDERTKNVDYEGALKVFDAIEGVKGPKPRLILVSTFDANDPDKFPPHYASLPNCFRVVHDHYTVRM
jgi:nucleoside-diphosphate-sugar epimerase